MQPDRVTYPSKEVVGNDAIPLIQKLKYEDRLLPAMQQVPMCAALLAAQTVLLLIPAAKACRQPLRFQSKNEKLSETASASRVEADILGSDRASCTFSQVFGRAMVCRDMECASRVSRQVISGHS